MASKVLKQLKCSTTKHSRHKLGVFDILLNITIICNGIYIPIKITQIYLPIDAYLLYIIYAVV